MVSAKEDFIAKAHRNMAFAVVFGIGSVALAVTCLAMNRGVLGAFGLVFACLNVMLFLINRNAALACRQTSGPGQTPLQQGRATSGLQAADAKRGTRAKARGESGLRRRRRVRAPQAGAAVTQPTPRR